MEIFYLFSDIEWCLYVPNLSKLILHIYKQNYVDWDMSSQKIFFNLQFKDCFYP